MNNGILGFIGGVVVGIGGTLLVEHILNKREDAKWAEAEESTDDDEDYIVGDYKSEINPMDHRRIPSEKPELEDIIDYGRYSDLSKKYNPDANPNLQAIIDAAIEEVVEDVDDPDGGKEYAAYLEEEANKALVVASENIFDTAEVISVKIDPKESIPPKFRNKPIVGKHDIEQITRNQFHTEAPDYKKKSCTFFVTDNLLVDCDDMKVMDVRTTVGQDILNVFEEGESTTLFVSNLSTMIDYEIVIDDGSYEEIKNNLKDYGDEVCRDETP